MARRKRGRGSVRFRKDIKKYVIDYTYTRKKGLTDPVSP